MEVFRKKAENYHLKLANRIHEKYTRESFLVKAQLSQLLFRGFYAQSLEKLFSRADFSGPNQKKFINAHKTFWKQIQGVFCEKMFLKIAVRTLAS